MGRESLYPLSDHALHRTLQTPPFQPLQATKPASRFHALDLIGVVAAVCAAVSAHPTKPIVASELAGAKPPAACPPQWLPVLVATTSSGYAPVDCPTYDFSAPSVADGGGGRQVIQKMRQLNLHLSFNPDAILLWHAALMETIEKNRVPGMVLECGVAKGGSAIVLSLIHI